MKRAWSFFASTLLALLSARAAAQEAPMPARELRDLPYAATTNPRQTLHLYLPPKSDAKPPLVVFIHGGGWRNGDKEGGRGTCRTLVERHGYAAATVGYRLSGEAVWPAQIHDCKAAIRYLRAMADQHGYDGAKIAVWGVSAGGHLVSLLGTSGDLADLEGDLGPHRGVSSRVQAVVDFCGPSDFASLVAPGRADQPGAAVAALFGKPISEVADAARLASPVTHVTADDPPFLIVHGTNDPTVPIAQAEALHAKLTAAGAKPVFVRVVDAGHAIMNRPTLDRVTAFLDHTLRGRGEQVSAEPIQAPEPRRGPFPPGAAPPPSDPTEAAW